MRAIVVSFESQIDIWTMKRLEDKTVAQPCRLHFAFIITRKTFDTHTYILYLSLFFASSSPALPTSRPFRVGRLWGFNEVFHYI